MNDVKKLPLWRDAVERFVAMNPGPGAIIPKKWFFDSFGIEKPVTAEDQIRAGLEFLSSMDRFRSELLEDYMIDLIAVPGEGYKIIPPEEQTKTALDIRSRNIANEISKMARSVAFVNTAALDDSQRREQADGLAKVAALKTMFKRRRLLE